MVLYELAYHLRLPMYELMDSMSYQELRNWMEYFGRRPAEWRQDQRTALIVQAFGAKVKAEDLFPSLQPVFEESRQTEEYHKKQALSNSFIAKMMGNNPDFLSFLKDDNGESNSNGR